MYLFCLSFVSDLLMLKLSGTACRPWTCATFAARMRCNPFVPLALAVTALAAAAAISTCSRRAASRMLWPALLFAAVRRRPLLFNDGRQQLGSNNAVLERKRIFTLGQRCDHSWEQKFPTVCVLLQRVFFFAVCLYYLRYLLFLLNALNVTLIEKKVLWRSKKIALLFLHKVALNKRNTFYAGK